MIMCTIKKHNRLIIFTTLHEIKVQCLWCVNFLGCSEAPGSADSNRKLVIKAPASSTLQMHPKGFTIATTISLLTYRRRQPHIKAVNNGIVMLYEYLGIKQYKDNHSKLLTNKFCTRMDYKTVLHSKCTFQYVYIHPFCPAGVRIKYVTLKIADNRLLKFNLIKIFLVT